MKSENPRMQNLPTSTKNNMKRTVNVMMMNVLVTRRGLKVTMMKMNFHVCANARPFLVKGVEVGFGVTKQWSCTCRGQKSIPPIGMNNRSS